MRDGGCRIREKEGRARRGRDEEGNWRQMNLKIF
jgi:hypothetical protein